MIFNKFVLNPGIITIWIIILSWHLLKEWLKTGSDPVPKTQRIIFQYTFVMERAQKSLNCYLPVQHSPLFFLMEADIML
jgi:hypothetical protein